MSWLLVAFIPGLLMLATFGLGRLEAGLDDDTVSPKDIVDVLEQAKADCAKPAARATAEETYPLVDDDCVDGYFEQVRVLIPYSSNPEFQPTRHAFRV